MSSLKIDVPVLSELVRVKSAHAEGVELLVASFPGEMIFAVRTDTRGVVTVQVSHELAAAGVDRLAIELAKATDRAVKARS